VGDKVDNKNLNSENKNDGNLLDHEYDGIRESDNDLPNWWLYTFYVSIVFALIYMVHYHWGGNGESQIESYNRTMNAADLEARSKPQAKSAFTDDEITKAMNDTGQKAQGLAVFNSRCVSCHGVGGAGGIGPNLVDKFWLHGGKPGQVAVTISEGVPEKGMISWSALMKREEIIAVAGYVKSLAGTHPANEKAPQGVKEDL
jgi:cytochrome c oxidase cbb3-type subunit III